MRGIELKNIDPTIKPAEDFYKFVNGGWLAAVEIPEDRSSWGSFHELAKSTDAKVIGILEEELQRKGPATNKAARLFESGMNTNLIEQAKLSPIQAHMSEVEDLKSHRELFSFVGQLNKTGMPAFLQLSVHPHLADSKSYAAYLEPAPLGLPERDFYLDDDEKANQIRNKYRQYIITILTDELAFSKRDAEDNADRILAMETSLAEQMLSKEKRRQIELLYNPFTSIQLNDSFRQIPWDKFFANLGISQPANVIVTEPAFITYLDKSFHHFDIATVINYVKFMMVHHAAPYAHASLEQVHFDLYHKELEGVEKMRPRQERLLKIINHYLGEALGQLFVDKYFPPHAKAAALEMVDDIVHAFRNRISNLEWMNENTKSYALEKLGSFRVKIGYPDRWKNYDDLHLHMSDDDESGSYLSNLLETVKWKFHRDAMRIDKDVDKEEWFMAPQIVNAYYNPMFNEIVFPAAILQPPFFDWEADAAVNYGGIGAVIGHEITHGFDDQGSRFDKHGNLNEWWSPEDRERFQALTKKLIDQFDHYRPFDDLSLNGTFTLGENIADLGGLSVAYDALQLYYERHGKPGEIDGFTPDQRFFMSWATVWRIKTRPEALRTQIKTDPHPPAMYRAVAAPSNLESFYTAFEISPDSQWYRREGERIKIW